MKHWTLDTYKNDSTIKVLTLDKAGASANVLSSEVLAEFSKVLDLLETDNSCDKLIIRSGKKDFILGADINEFDVTKTPDEIIEFVNTNHSVLAKIRELPMTTVAVINGMCLGGGTELALYCDYIVAANDKATRIGLPEVHLGILPGYGGFHNTINRMGDIQAISFILSGKPMPSRKAVKLGLVDSICLPSALMRTAVELKPTPRKPKGLIFGRFIRRILAIMFRKQVAKKADKRFYPAPYKIIDHYVRYGNNSNIVNDSVAIQELFYTDSTKGLLRCFHLQNVLKKIPRKTMAEVSKIRRVHVVGAGVMGADIASWCAIKGFDVTLHDINTDVLSRAIKRTHTTMKKIRALDAIDRFSIDVSGDGALDADIIIEAVLERIDIKTSVLKQLESVKKPGAILATNTSSIMIEDLQASLQTPDELLGLHFFNPVAQMQLVEIVTPADYNPYVYDELVQFVKDIGKLPLPVKSHPGFLVNRVLLPYMCRAVELVDLGYSPERVDQAALDFGMPMGPIRLGDTVGLDICLNVSTIFEEKLGEGYKVPELLKTMVADGRLGKKSGQGFYGYKEDASNYSTAYASFEMSEEELSNDLRDVFVEECRKALDEGIVTSEEHLDAGAIFATGFCPFHGGPSKFIV